MRGEGKVRTGEECKGGQESKGEEKQGRTGANSESKKIKY